MAWDGYESALSSDYDGVFAVLAKSDGFRATDARRAISPSVKAELAWIVENESGWNPAARNKYTDASGLIQFMPDTAKGMFGLSVAEIRGMTRKQQAKLVGDYYSRILKSTGPVNRPGDLYLATFYPAAMSKDDDFIIFPVDSKGWEQNKGLREPGDGPITAGSVRRKGIPSSLPPSGFPDDAPKDKPTRAGGQGGSWGAPLLLVLTVLAAGRMLRRGK